MQELPNPEEVAEAQEPPLEVEAEVARRTSLVAAGVEADIRRPLDGALR